MRSDSGVAGEGRVVGVPKFHFCGKYTIPLTNINSDWMSNASSGLCIILVIHLFTQVLQVASWGVIIRVIPFPSFQGGWFLECLMT